MSQPEYTSNPEIARQLEYAEHYNRFLAFLDVHGERILAYPDKFFVMPRLISATYGFIDTEAVTIQSEYGLLPDERHKEPELIIRTLELGQEGTSDDDYAWLARSTWGYAHKGAWFWRETKIQPPQGGLSRAWCYVQEYIDQRAQREPLPSSGRADVMRQIYPYFQRLHSVQTRPVLSELRLLASMVGVLE
jgi:hypothetical protein